MAFDANFESGVWPEAGSAVKLESGHSAQGRLSTSQIESNPWFSIFRHTSKSRTGWWAKSGLEPSWLFARIDHHLPNNGNSFLIRPNRATGRNDLQTRRQGHGEILVALEVAHYQDQVLAFNA